MSSKLGLILIGFRAGWAGVFLPAHRLRSLFEVARGQTIKPSAHPTQLGLWLIGLCLSLQACAAEDCARLEQSFQQDIKANRLDAADAQLKKMQTACPQAVLRDDELFFTETLATQANALADRKQLDAAEALLKKAKLDSWTVSSVRGYIASLRPEKQRNWREIANHYGHALELLTNPNDPKLKDIPNLKALQAQILALAAEAQVIYGKPDATIQRDGNPRGVFLASVRGVGAGSIPYPVHFDTDKASLTTDGLASADALAQFIGQQKKFQSVTLIGHADPRGSDAHNQKLSEDRAATVANLLKAKGIQITIATAGKGESEPPATLYDNLSEQEKFSRWRRVELKFQ